MLGHVSPLNPLGRKNDLERKKGSTQGVRPSELGERGEKRT